MNPVFWEQPKDDDEIQASALSPEDREFVINKLAEMLVNDYQQHQQNQSVMDDTIKEPPAFNRGGGQCYQAAVSERAVGQVQRDGVNIQLYS